MPTVPLDQDVYEELGKHVRGFETPNDVLRRMLFGEEDKKPEQVQAHRRPGSLQKLLDAGLIKPGDRLVHHQKRLKASHYGTVEADGWVTTLVNSYKDLSPALGALVGTPISGPAFWIHEPSGKSINQLKAQL